MIDETLALGDDDDPRSDAAHLVWLWDKYANLIGEPVTPPELAQAYINGFQAAGVNAKNGEAWTSGSKFPSKLPMVVQFQCPYWHRTEDGGGFASVALVIEEDGWWGIHRTSRCERCGETEMLEWLFTCQRCRRGEISDDHNPDPEDLEFMPCDGSPFMCVVAELHRLALRAESRWWTEHTEEARAEYIANEAGTRYNRVLQREVTVTLRQAEQRAGGRLEAARRSLASTEVITLTKKVWTVEQAAEWLDGLKDAEGKPLVPVEATARRAWALVRGISGHPPKNTLEASLKVRKAQP